MHRNIESTRAHRGLAHRNSSRTYFLPSTIFKTGLWGVRVEILGMGGGERDLRE